MIDEVKQNNAEAIMCSLITPGGWWMLPSIFAATF
jgi:hypothetical protein